MKSLFNAFKFLSSVQFDSWQIYFVRRKYLKRSHYPAGMIASLKGFCVWNVGSNVTLRRSEEEGGGGPIRLSTTLTFLNNQLSVLHLNVAIRVLICAIIIVFCFVWITRLLCCDLKVWVFVLIFSVSFMCVDLLVRV